MAKSLRAVTDSEHVTDPEITLSLVAAVESGDVLAMLLAQRRMVADSLTRAAENTIPQLNNELNKLHALIAAEELRRVSAADEAREVVTVPDGGFSATAL